MKTLKDTILEGLFGGSEHKAPDGIDCFSKLKKGDTIYYAFMVPGQPDRYRVSVYTFTRWSKDKLSDTQINMNMVDAHGRKESVLLSKDQLDKAATIVSGLKKNYYECGEKFKVEKTAFIYSVDADFENCIINK